MRYSVRQEQCLQAMGIVPWVSRFPADAAALAATASVSEESREATDDRQLTELAETTEATEATEAAGIVDAPVTAAPLQGEAAAPAELAPNAPQETSPEVAVPMDPPVAVPTTAPLSRAAQPPHAADALGAWLQTMSITPIEFRGGLHPVLGVTDAPLLVVLALQNATPSRGSMAGDDGRLFELMLRSISMSNRDTRRCMVDIAPGETAVAGPGASVDVSSLCSAATRGVLVLMDPWTLDGEQIAAEHHQSRLPGSGLPVWRVAHPAILLEQPLLKRQAWQVLKRLRTVLDGDPLS